MTVEEVLIEKIKVLPMNRKQEMLDFAEFLGQKEVAPIPRRSLYGILADAEVNISDEDIAEARREMWENFPREQFFDGEEKP